MKLTTLILTSTLVLVTIFGSSMAEEADTSCGVNSQKKAIACYADQKCCRKGESGECVNKNGGKCPTGFARAGSRKLK